MIDEDAISVSITASKEMESAVPAMPDGNGKSSATSAAVATTSSSKNKVTVYTVFVRNVHTGGKCVVKRRYSDFFKLRKQLIEFVSWGHCGHCNRYFMDISGYPFPRRRLLRSSRPTVVKERMDSLGLFLRHLLLRIMTKSFSECLHAKRSIEDCILKSFLEVDSVESIFPTTPSKTLPLMNMGEEKRLHSAKVSSIRSKSLGYAVEAIDKQRMYEDLKRARSDRNVSTDTCGSCMQKWTNCYCNEEDDHIYPVAGLAQLRLSEAEDYDLPPMERRNSCSSDDSDASQCSRCEREWDRCFCCQQVSPTASSNYSHC
ncbi:TPA: hypothetical protein N0F65_006801 [Lagenidium giganteum]|uniref:PX domain-containing protein n=1 Tax=Lagenidium giganteum TaxID=4803 RepID=A0AAV2ZA33_9STRA|nr:TPA: hypothetical protein N0F65_006801 [Lagenidium giganteum]